MSRIGKQPIIVPKEVKAEIKEKKVSVQGPKGSLSFNFDKLIKIDLAENTLSVTRKKDSKLARSLHGTTRAILANLIKGVTEGFKKELEVVGVGYKAQMKGKALDLSLGFSHPVEFAVPEGIKVSLPSNTRITIEGIDKQKVGQFAAKIRKIYPPEPYKGKGIRYLGEEVRKKIGKALAK
ncbi:MAG: 50S ribosomal protein L6 [Candidatus Omnitrophica bacterium]|nr:50S ribosomal protein L6 [Candidatus Omnitrophota bacterium]MCF7876918.1 50S ribosomal protein L6 [Candidatus Omnitrophota bacterium]MCF7878018.1 50S ribosomal protein L6 [Candidatus Omnitrophota bacterium]MCF7893190.1 50S ribosomal protein L6 [Candidatus Omnitrophota bacterium]